MAVAGNCDSAAIDQRLIELDVSLFGRGVMVGDLGFYGVSAMPPWTGHMYELTEKQIAGALEAGQRQLDESCREILLTHTPPRDTRLDAIRHGDHVGSSSVREFIELTRPALVICGHIHEARGIDRLGPTQMVNCGTAFRGHYALVEVGADLKIELRTTA
jgi:Icc-related predicted phosphoesterase